MDFILNTRNNTVLVQQKWKYNWLNESGTTPWTLEQKRNMHHSLDALIWQQWAGHYRVHVTGTSVFARDNRSTVFTINFDIKWVQTSEHWTVNMTKTTNPRTVSSVNWNRRVMNLDSLDTRVKTLSGITGQRGITHEFGHSIGNSTFAFRGSHGDEYRSGNTFFRDRASIMNHGAQLRQRHLDFVLRELQTLIPNTTFHFNALL
ncbi:hypothetical protein [Cochleicola gelatinilyticus]|uniref:Uncharacterized protein n=1 Tax=Cochleicola gelatinilyticus TaxID=1763537 RepID=A0A167HLE8_9FLAO|nr:hypothetical protein [Cochleicola gelatinilyticus]OAB78735.1 hypothetical protein ULVI_09135 [Cochleicola gelatinilyticus]